MKKLVGALCAIFLLWSAGVPAEAQEMRLTVTVPERSAETPGEEFPGEKAPGEEIPGEETPGEETEDGSVRTGDAGKEPILAAAAVLASCAAAAAAVKRKKDGQITP